MHFDALTLTCITGELQQTVANGRVQQVLAPDDESFCLEIYAQRRRLYLLIALNAQACRIHLTSQKLRRGAEKPTPLLLLLRKYVRDSVLTAVEQPDPTERVLQLRVNHLEHGPTTLVVEIMGQRSNLLLLKPNGMLLECWRRVPPGEGAQRVLLPGKPYSPPHRPDKLPPFDDARPDYYERLQVVTQQPGPLWKALVDKIAGLSPTLARETAWRVLGRLDGAAQEVSVLALAQTLQQLWAPVQQGGWQPGLWLEGARALGFSAYPAHIRGLFAPVESMSAAVEQFYAQRDHEEISAEVDAYAGLRASVAKLLRRASQRVQRQQTALAGDEPAPGEAAAVRTQAEWLLALHQQLDPGATSLKVELDDQTLEIALDPNQTPVEQAQQMFKRATRLERAAKFIPERRAQLEADQQFLAQLENDLAQAANQPEIAAVREELEKAGFLSPAQQPRPQERVDKKASQPLRFASPQGFEILVGRNARQNELVTFHLAGPGDIWLHARGAPGAHVVIRCGGQPVNEETLLLAAQLAAYHSGLRGERAATVAYTQRRFVSRAPGGRTGQVILMKEETITAPAILPEG